MESSLSRLLVLLVALAFERGTAIADAPAVTSPQTFDYTGAIQTFTVPSNVKSINIDASGAQGGGSYGGAGGKGARMIGTFAVRPGQVLSIVVGQQGLLQTGGNAQNSSGGGGGTFVYIDSGEPTLLVAAGGGGGKCNFTGSQELHSGADGQITTAGGASSNGNAGGTGGNGGPAGLFSDVPCAGGGAGWLTAGGSIYGGQGYPTWTGGAGFSGGGGGGTGGVGGFGGGGGGGNHYGGGGGGGGYSGGGGGTDPHHGGGGGSYSVGTSQDNTAGYKTGDGQVIISWTISTNNTPTIVGSGVPDQVLNLTGGAVTIDLAAYFADADKGDVLSYAVKLNTLATIATARITTGHYLTLTPVALGTTQVTLSVSDSAIPPEEVTQTINVKVVTSNPTLTVVSLPKLNKQTGLIEEKIKVKNTMGRSIDGFRVRVTNLPSKYKLWNASTQLIDRNTTTVALQTRFASLGPAFVDFPETMLPDAEVELTLEFFSPTHGLGSLRPAFSVVELVKPLVPKAIGEGALPTRLRTLNGGGVMVTFASIPGHTYQVVYSDSAGMTWRLSPVGIKAGGTSVNWIDRGAPNTISLPALPLTRLYRIQDMQRVLRN